MASPLPDASARPPAARVHSFFDRSTGTATHVLWCPATRRAAVIDSVLDFDPRSGRSATRSADRVLDFLRDEALAVDWLLETHVHADHFSAAAYLRDRVGGRIAIGAGIRQVQQVFKPIFNAAHMGTDGTPFDQLFTDGERFAIGELQATVMHTPGHTPACVCYVVGGDAFVGDTLFMPDAGSARCDFPGGDARTLFRSIRRILALPAETRLHLCHDYPPAHREATWCTTVAAQRAANVHVHDGIAEDDFVARRTARDRTLDMPALLLPAIQVNAQAGRFPPAEDNGVRYLKIPLDAL
ncbi:MBL fold metallo-hydrolase [Aquincola sp. MAHUQ-54]|uniref:MBL fold metallo-hydrolase n=1 Tax=Aquincola agrisoli TaxID=3119538 RepID=A0AAW9Q8J7_9BURK